MLSTGIKYIVRLSLIIVATASLPGHRFTFVGNSSRDREKSGWLSRYFDNSPLVIFAVRADNFISRWSPNRFTVGNSCRGSDWSQYV